MNQILFCERNKDGTPKFEPNRSELSSWDHFKQWWFFNGGVTDEKRLRQLWKEQQEREARIERQQAGSEDE